MTDLSTPPLRYLGLVSGRADGGTVRLQLVTPADRVREVPLDRAELVRIISRAADALAYLDDRDRRAAKS